MSYLADTVCYQKPDAASGSVGQLVYIAPDPPNPEQVINVRLSNGSAFYTAGGTTVSGGAALSADQGSPNLLSQGWPVKITDGSAVIGVQATPLWITGSLGLSSFSSFIALSGSVQGLLVGGQSVSLENPAPVQQVDRPTHVQRYDIGTGTIYFGYAERGTLSSTPSWTIKRTYLDSNGNPSIIQWALTSSWDSRVGLSYS